MARSTALRQATQAQRTTHSCSRSDTQPPATMSPCSNAGSLWRASVHSGPRIGATLGHGPTQRCQIDRRQPTAVRTQLSLRQARTPGRSSTRTRLPSHDALLESADYARPVLWTWTPIPGPGRRPNHRHRQPQPLPERRSCLPPCPAPLRRHPA